MTARRKNFQMKLNTGELCKVREIPKVDKILGGKKGARKVRIK